MKYFEKITTFRFIMLLFMMVGAVFLNGGWLITYVKPTDFLANIPFVNMGKTLLVLSIPLLLLDAFVQWLRTPDTRSDSGRKETSVIPPPAPRKKMAGILGSLYHYLFQYRIIDPDQERIDSELRVARQIQFSLVPKKFPAYSEWREFDLHSVLSPAKEVAGDYYDFFLLDSDRLVFTVGDVSGKGVPASLYMAVSRTAFRTLAGQAKDAAELMNRLNDMLVGDNQSGLYVTIACFIVHLPTGKCQYVLAGHPAPLWRHGQTGTTEFIDQPRDIFVGLKTGVSYPLGHMQLEPGDTILVYSDGLSEARNAEREDLGYEGLEKLFNQHAGAERCQIIIEEMRKSLVAFSGTEQEDDITMLAFRYWGPGGQEMRRRRKRSRPGRISNAAQT